jgi:uncharacterized protein involved in outer membrane biogenesis
MAMSRGGKIASWTIGSILAIVAIVIIVLMTFDWNRAKPWINARVSEAIGRPFAINGDLSLAWDRAPEAMSGWRRWVPWPHLNARDVTVANTDFSTLGETMAVVREIQFSISPLALLGKHIEVPTLRIDAPEINLQNMADNRNNWTFKKSEDDTPSAWTLELQKLILTDGRVRYLDAVRKADVKAGFGTITDGGGGKYGLAWTADGTYNAAPFKGSGKLGEVLSLRAASETSPPYPVQVSLDVGKTSIDAEGTLTNPRALAALELQVKISGASMAQLFPLTGVLLPETPPYSTSGHLVGLLNVNGGDWTYEKFTGKVGSSDLSGTLQFQNKKPRPFLRGDVVSNRLAFDDLAPVIGADSAESQKNRGVKDTQPKTRLLPVEQFKTDRWRQVDVDVKFTGRKILKDESLPIDDLTTHLKMNDGVLTLMPLNFGVAGGDLRSNITLDGRNPVIRADMKMSVRHLKLKQLLPSVKEMQPSLGEANGDVALSGTGNTIAGILGGANGEVKLVVRDGTISKFLVEAIGLNVGNVVLTKLFGDKQTKINCLASDFEVAKGQMTPRIFVVDTEDSVVNVTGLVNLTDEELGLTINPESKGLRIFSLRAPIYVKGTFVKPDIDIDRKVLALKAGGAVALAVVAPVATALLPLANLGDDQDSPCRALLAKASEKPVAPAPGHTATGTR